MLRILIKNTREDKIQLRKVRIYFICCIFAKNCTMNTNEIDKIISETRGGKSTSSFMVLLVIILLLLIDFFPYFKSLEIINPQFFYLSILNLLLGIYFYCNYSSTASAVFPLLRRSSIFKLYLAFVILCGVSFFAARNTSLVLTKLTEIVIVFCLFINLTILLKDKLNLLYKIVLIVGISAFVQACQQLCNFIIIPRHASVIDLLNAMKGNTGNINILAASLTIKIPFLLLGIAHFTSYKKYFLIVALFSVTAVVFLTGARTPLINLFLIYFIFIAFTLKSSFSKQSFIKIIYIIIPVLIAVLFANSIFEKSKDKSRYVSLENRVSQISTNDQSSQARLAFWRNTIKMSQKNPILGIGLGNYQVESIPYERTISNDNVVSLHAHNDFLEILAETGIVNSLIYLSLFILVFIVNLKNLIKKNTSEVKVIALLTLMLLIVYGIDSMFNFPMYRPTMSIFFCLLLAFSILNNCSLKEKNLDTKIVKILFGVLIIISIITSYSAFLIYKASNLEYLIASDDINMNQKGMLTGDEVVKRMPKYPNTLSTSESFSEYAGIYYVREKQYEKALKYFSKASKINSQTGYIEFYKQVIARHKGNIDSAYIYSKEAFYMRPRNYAFFNTAINFAISKRDSTEILKEHKLFSEYRSMPKAWDLVAKGLISTGYSYKNVTSFIDEGLRKFPRDSALLRQKNQLLITNYLVGGQKLENSLELDMALKSYEESSKIDSKIINAKLNIGLNYLKQGQNKKAITFLSDALKYPGLTDGKAEFYIGIAYLKENDKINALKYFSISKNKNYPLAKELISNHNNSSLHNEKASVKKKNDLLIADYISEGQKLEGMSKFNEALEVYNKALKIDPINIYAFQNIGFYYLKQGENKKAISNLLKALKYPGLNDGKTEYFLGISYLKENDKINACKYFTIARNKNYTVSDELIKLCK